MFFKYYKVYGEKIIEDDIYQLGYFVYFNDNIYEGEMKNNIKHGKGTLYLTDNSKYEGSWLNDRSYGLGKFSYSNGDIYEGEWINNVKHGQGTYIYMDGSKYEGEWKNNKKDGYGIFNLNDNSIYKGNFIDDSFNGKGIINYSDNTKYEGDFKEGKKHGHGVFYSLNDYYEGSFIDDSLNGHGCYHSTIFESQYICGIFKNNKLVEVTDLKIPLLDESMKYTKVADGVHLVAYYKNIHNKQILLLGENHNNILKCKGNSNSKDNDNGNGNDSNEEGTSLLEWFKNFNWHKDECLDLFIEDYLLKGNLLRGISKYANELSTIKDNFRYHYIDYRHLIDNNEIYYYDIVNYFIHYSDRLLELQSLYNVNVNDNEKIIDFFITGDNGEHLINLVNSINIYLKIPLTDNIQKWSNQYSIVIKKRISKLDPLINLEKMKKILKKNYNNGFSDLLCIPMDIYCIMRLFTQFKDKESQSINKCHQRIDNVVIYGGSSHIIYYIKFLNEYFSLKPNYLVENFQYQCVDIPSSMPKNKNI